MNKEIIIDGVNVAECIYFYKKDGSCMSGDCECTKCIHNYCYFKQFKKLEQENKELKLALDMFNKQCKKINVENIEKSFNTYIEYTKNLKKENEELKEEKGGMQIVIDNYIEHSAKYKQALEEIKKWATNHIPCDIKEGFNNCTKEDCFECLNYDLKRITNIIDEVLKNE